MNIVWWNQEWVDPEKALFPISNRGLKYGDGIFESFRVINKHWIFQALHVDRLHRGAEALLLSLPTELIPEIQMALNALDQIMPQAFCSLRVFRSGAGKYTPESNQANWFLEASGLSQPLMKIPDQGIEVDLCQSVKLSPHVFSNYKTSNALPFVIASMEKQERGFDDLIIPGPANNLVEATSSNIVVIKGKNLTTPPLSQGCLDGIMRRVLLQAAITDFACFETPIFQADLENADEIWLVNSSTGIRWVKKFKKHTFVGVQARTWQSKLNEKILTQLEQ